LGRESQNYAAEISLLASRRAGEILSELEKSNGGRPRKTHATVSSVSEYKRVLIETNTSERKAQRWQELAKIPEATVCDYIEQSKIDPDDEISSSGLLKRAKKSTAKKNPTRSLLRRSRRVPLPTSRLGSRSCCLNSAH
jgi:hypothetical protein